MIELKNLVTEELNKPGITKQDILKFLFQNEFGPGHNIENPIDYSLSFRRSKPPGIFPYLMNWEMAMPD